MSKTSKSWSAPEGFYNALYDYLLTDNVHWAHQPSWEFEEAALLSMNLDPSKFPTNGWGAELCKISTKAYREFKRRKETFERFIYDGKLNRSDKPSAFIKIGSTFDWEFSDKLVELVKKIEAAAEAETAESREEEQASDQTGSSKKYARVDVERNIDTILYAVTQYLAKHTASSNQKGVEEPNLSEIGKKLHAEISDELKKERPIEAKTISNYLTNARNAVLHPESSKPSKA